MRIKDNRKVAFTGYSDLGEFTISVMHPDGRIEDMTIPGSSYVTVWLPIGSYLRTSAAVSVVGAALSDVTVDNFLGDGATWYIIKEGVHYNVTIG